MSTDRKRWFSFIETGETFDDAWGSRPIWRIEARFVKGADHVVKTFDVDRAIDSWHVANQTTTHADVIFDQAPSCREAQAA